MPRSDYSSDPDDASLTSDDDQVIGPRSAVAQQSPAPWQIGRQNDRPATPVTSASLNSPLQEVLRLARPGAGKAAVTGPNARFRSAVLKVMRLKRIEGLKLGDDLGVDVTSDAAQARYGPIRQRSSIQIIDYGVTKCRFAHLTNEELPRHVVSFRLLASRHVYLVDISCRRTKV